MNKRTLLKYIGCIPLSALFPILPFEEKKDVYSFDIEKIEVKARSRALEGEWTFEWEADPFRDFDLFYRSSRNEIKKLLNEANNP